MKKIGREVLFLEANETNPRNGEGAFIRLRDGRILYAFTEYTGSGWDDHCHADICGIYSADEGESWSERRRLLTADENAANLMSVSFMRMENGDMGLFYLRKDQDTGSCKLYLTRSADEGESWSEPLCCMGDEGYYVVNNDRVIRLRSGRLLIPCNQHEIIEKFKAYGKGRLNFLASDDDGRSWKKLLKENIAIPGEEQSHTGLQESGVYQHEDGTIWAWSRTGFGSQYSCYSKDDGASWSVPVPSEFFTSPTAPMQVKKAGKYTLAIWNPIPNFNGRDRTKTWGRTPYLCAVSEDDGRQFPKIFYLEDDPDNGFCYPAVLGGEGYFLVAYYHSNNTGVCLNSNKIVKVLFEELD